MRRVNDGMGMWACARRARSVVDSHPPMSTSRILCAKGEGADKALDKALSRYVKSHQFLAK
jgi:hypothetical protein